MVAKYVDEDRNVSITRAAHRQRERKVEIGRTGLLVSTWVEVRSSLFQENSLKQMENGKWVI